MTDPAPTVGPATGQSVEYPPEAPRSTLDILAALDPATATAAVNAGAGLVLRAGDLWDALNEVSHTNTARPAIEVITDIALTAALTPET